MKRFLIITSIFMLSLVSCSTRSSESSKAFTENENGETVEVNKGDSFTITLESNPTTGYMWAVDSVDISILTHEDQFTYQSQSDLVGGGGAETITFEAIAPGETTIQLKYWRSFEADKPPIETFKLKVIVK